MPNPYGINSQISLVLPQPPALRPGSQSFNERWRVLPKWYTDLVQSLQRAFGVTAAAFQAINRQLILATGLPITVGGAQTPLASALATLNGITQIVLVIGNIELTTDAGNDPVAFFLTRSASPSPIQVALDYLPAVGAGQNVGKTLIGIDSNLSVGQYTYNLLAQTAGAGGNTIVTAAKIATVVI
jgi:hypothetical protein